MDFYATSVRRRILGPAQALDLVRFWDGLIVLAALDAHCDVLRSEDLQHGRRFGSLEVVDPFLPAAAHERETRSGLAAFRGMT